MRLLAMLALALVCAGAANAHEWNHRHGHGHRHWDGGPRVIIIPQQVYPAWQSETIITPGQTYISCDPAHPYLCQMPDGGYLCASQPTC